MRAFWVTFYSYKGGVGRSTALANVAGLLAQQGRRVLMVDFDLEAPGLDSFEEFNVEPNQQGIVEYVSEYLQSRRAPSIEPYVQTIQLPGFSCGKLWLIPAGRKDHAYNHQRSAINWSSFYEENDGALFFENFKADIEDTFNPDFVFIDSRTGLTDVGGICTAHLPSMVVLLFALNEQNLRGIAAVAKVLETSEKAPQLLPVATPIPNLPRSATSLVDDRFLRAREVLGLEPKITINYSPEVSLRERVYALSENGERSMLAAQYRKLKAAIVDAAPEGLDYLIQQARQATENFDPERAEEIRSTLALEYADRPDAWLWHAELSRTLGDMETYASNLWTTLELDPNNEEAFSKLDGFLRAKKQWDELSALMHSLLAKGHLIKGSKRDDLEHELGLLFMHLNRPSEAYPYFLNCFQNAIEKREAPGDAIALLVANFNVLESARRARVATELKWSNVVELFELAQAANAADSIQSRMNRLQAMHIAYACSNNIRKAIELLEDVEKLAKNVSSRERLFCVSTYNPLSRDEFLEINQRMLNSLRDHKLWDGYALPSK